MSLIMCCHTVPSPCHANKMRHYAHDQVRLYCATHKRRYPGGMFWINAGTLSELRTGFAVLAKGLSCGDIGLHVEAGIEDIDYELATRVLHKLNSLKERYSTAAVAHTGFTACAPKHPSARTLTQRRSTDTSLANVVAVSSAATCD